MTDQEKHQGIGLRPSEVPCECPEGCACETPVIRGEGACEGCTRADDGTPGTDHVPCVAWCQSPYPHVGLDGALGS